MDGGDHGHRVLHRSALTELFLGFDSAAGSNYSCCHPVTKRNLLVDYGNSRLPDRLGLPSFSSNPLAIRAQRGLHRGQRALLALFR